MGVFDMGGFIGQVTDVLEEINVDQAVINSIASVLMDHAESIESHRPTTLTPSVLGGSWRGQELGHHAELAHQHVVDGITQMMADLTGIGDTLVQYGRVQTENDALAAEEFARLNAQLENGA